MACAKNSSWLARENEGQTREEESKETKDSKPESEDAKESMDSNVSEKLASLRPQR